MPWQLWTSEQCWFDDGLVAPFLTSPAPVTFKRLQGSSPLSSRWLKPRLRKELLELFQVSSCYHQTMDISYIANFVHISLHREACKSMKASTYHTTIHQNTTSICRAPQTQKVPAAASSFTRYANAAPNSKCQPKWLPPSGCASLYWIMIGHELPTCRISNIECTSTSKTYLKTSFRGYKTFKSFYSNCKALYCNKCVKSIPKFQNWK